MVRKNIFDPRHQGPDANNRIEVIGADAHGNSGSAAGPNGTGSSTGAADNGRSL